MNYSTVVSSVQSWFEDDGAEFLAAIPQIIELGERRVFKDAPNLLANRTTATGNLVSGTATITVPTGLRVVRGLSITVTNAQVFLERRIDSWLYDKYTTASTTAQPVYFAESNETTIVFGPTPDDTYAYTLYYLRQPTGLSSSNATTWLGDTHEDVLLYAIYREAAAFLRDSEATGYWAQRYEEEIARLGAEVKRTYLNEYGAGA
jgi:hypothetical protein|tara:strand:- start:861 stop:1475 length:615 start_codon:yes stop_codon:yes gene_type:complete